MAARFPIPEHGTGHGRVPPTAVERNLPHSTDPAPLDFLRLGRCGDYRDEDGYQQFLATLEAEQVRAEKLVRHGENAHGWLLAFVETINEYTDSGQWAWVSVDQDLVLSARREPGSRLLQLNVQLSGSEPGGSWRAEAEFTLDRDETRRMTDSIALLS